MVAILICLSWAPRLWIILIGGATVEGDLVKDERENAVGSWSGSGLADRSLSWMLLVSLNCEYVNDFTKCNDDVKHCQQLLGWKFGWQCDQTYKGLEVAETLVWQKNEVKTFLKLKTGNSSSLDELWQSCPGVDKQTRRGEDERQTKRFHDLSSFLLLDKKLAEVSCCF